jgi:uncharacterized protein involved in cysteine biosynthesis
MEHGADFAHDGVAVCKRAPLVRACVCVFVCVRNAVYFNLVLWKLMNQCSFCPYLWGPEAPRWASLIELCLGTLAKLALLSIGRDSLVR